MTSKEIDIADMQCWLVRMAQNRWGVPAAEVARIFGANGVLSYIREMYDLLHLSGYERALDDVEGYLRSGGAALCWDL